MAAQSTITNPSRRLLLAALPAAALAPLPAVAAVVDADPILAAIKGHRDAWQAFDDAVEATDDDYGLTEAERAIEDAEEDAWAALLHEPCATLEAARAKAEYFLTCPRVKNSMWEDWEARLLLRSLLQTAA